MLMEGLLQLLVSRQVLTADEIVRTVETVIATKQQMIIDGEHPEISLIAAGVLSTPLPTAWLQWKSPAAGRPESRA